MNAIDSVEELFQTLKYSDPLARPKHQRLTDLMVEGIREGIWKTGDRLPAEEELTQLTPYSLGTVQRAMRNLSDQGLISRMHGLGSFIAAPPRALLDPWHCRFLADDGVSFLPIYSRAEDRSEVKGVGPWSQHLGVGPGIMRLDRIVNVNEEFNIFSRFYCDKNITASLWNLPLHELHGANFKKLIIEDCRLPITEISHMIKVVQFQPEICERVDQPLGRPGLFIQAVAYAGRNRVVYYQEFMCGPTERALMIPESAAK